VSGIVGVVRFAGASRVGDAEQMLAALRHRAPTRGEWWAANDAERCAVELGAFQGVFARQTAAGRLVLVADARLDDRDALHARLGRPAGTASDAELILLAYERWGTECAAQLVGDFAFAVWNERTRTLVCVRDPMGVRPLYLHRGREFFAFASEAKALFTLPEVPRRLSDEQVALFLEAELHDRTTTMFDGIERLPAAHTIQVTPERATAVEYWRPDPHRAVGCSSPGEYVDAFRSIFVAAVADRMRDASAVGTTLSGGLDSSSVTCVAADHARTTGTAVHSFSLVFDGLDAADFRLSDERTYMDDVIARGGLHPHFVRGDALSPLGGIDRTLWHLDEPHFAPNLYLHQGMFAAARENGVGVLLDGFDGDSTVSHGFGRLTGLARAGDWDAFEREARAFAAHRGIAPARLLDEYGRPHLAELARTGRPLRWMRTAATLRRRFQLSGRELVVRDGLRPLRARLGRRTPDGTQPASSILRADVYRAIAPALPRDEDGVRSEAELHVSGLTQPLYQLTLEIADKASRAFGLEARYPFFDRRLIDFCVAVPESLKFADGWPRHLFRRAMEGILPPAVQWRATKASLAPNFHRAIRSTDRRCLESLVDDAERLARWIDPRALRATFDRYVQASAWRGREVDGYQLFRAAVLHRWLGDATHTATVAPSHTTTAMPVSP